MSDTTETTVPPTLEEKARARYFKETAEHRLTVLRDDALYRHLRCQQPGTYMYGFDIVTWPGYLTVAGDCGTFVFSRITDMFEFFGNGRGINPHYWAQKLQAPRSDVVRVYAFDAYQDRVREWVADRVEDLEASEAAALRAAVAEQLLDDPYGIAYHDEGEAHRRLRDFEHDGIHLLDTREWDLREYDWQFLWCCWAIVDAIDLYRNGRPS